MAVQSHWGGTQVASWCCCPCCHVFSTKYLCYIDYLCNDHTFTYYVDKPFVCSPALGCDSSLPVANCCAVLLRAI